MRSTADATDLRLQHAYTVTLMGKAYHSGATRGLGLNAIVQTAAFLHRLTHTLRERGIHVTPVVQSLDGGEGLSQVPDRATLHLAFSGTTHADTLTSLVEDCVRHTDAQQQSKGSTVTRATPRSRDALTSMRLNVDMRTTPLFGDAWANRHLAAALEQAGEHVAATHEVVVSQPSFVTSANDPLRGAMQTAVKHSTPRDVPAMVCGPSNVGNLLATHGIPAVLGHGISFKGLHAHNESVSLASIPTAYATYRHAARILAGLEPPPP